MSLIWHALRDALLMAWEVWWALVLGFAISAVVQAWVSRERVARALGGDGARPVAFATGLGAASSSCSYAAVAIAKRLFQKGASVASTLAFQFASTNLVLELGIVIWLLLGWRFALAEVVGGIALVAVTGVLARAFISRPVEERARAHARDAETGHSHEPSVWQATWRGRLRSLEAWSDVAHNFRNDWAMLWKEIVTGFVLAGFAAQLPAGFYRSLFLTHSGGAMRLLENVVVGPVIAVLSFVCSVGNVPLAAVLWSGGISFGGVIAFIFADLIVLPIVAIYRKYYGGAFTVRLVALMATSIVIAALLVDGMFSLAGLVPRARPTHAEIFGSLVPDYRFATNAVAFLVFFALIALTVRRGATDPVCGMRVDRRRAVRIDDGGEARYFCSRGCAERFRREREGEDAPVHAR